MTLSCLLIRALRASIRAIDWLGSLSIEVDEETATGLCGFAFLWIIVSTVWAAIFEWGWWSLTSPIFVAAAITAFVYTLRGIACGWAALRRWTEARYVQCVKEGS